MTESSIRRPAGVTGPLLRAAVKTIASNEVKEPMVLPSFPWRVDRSYKWSSMSWPASGITDKTKTLWSLGLPSGAAAGTAIVLRHLLVGSASDGTAGAAQLVQLARWYSLTGGSTSGGSILKDNTDFADSVSVLGWDQTGSRSDILTTYVARSLAAHQYEPVYKSKYLITKSNWVDALVLRPGEHVGLDFDDTPAAPAANGHERLTIQAAWDEVTL